MWGEFGAAGFDGGEVGFCLGEAVLAVDPFGVFGEGDGFEAEGEGLLAHFAGGALSVGAVGGVHVVVLFGGHIVFLSFFLCCVG